MAKETVLITGSAGFVGSHIVEHILENTDWNIVGLDSFRHRGDSLRVTGDPSRYQVICHDLTSPISSRLSSKIGHVDYILNVASESHVDRSIDDPVPFVENNVKLILNMLEYAREIKPKMFIQVSTDEVYGAAIEGMDHKEWEVILPSNPYAASKAAQEAIAISYWRTYDVPLVITNTMNMFGERQDKEKFIPMLISKMMKDEVITIHGSKEYIGKRHYLHARNFADALLSIMKDQNVMHYEDSPDEIIKPNRYNIVGDVEKNNLELAFDVAEILGRAFHYELVDFHAARPGHDRRYSLDGRKIRDEFGWIAPVNYYDSLKKTVEWTLKNKEWL